MKRNYFTSLLCVAAVSCAVQPSIMRADADNLINNLMITTFSDVALQSTYNLSRDNIALTHDIADSMLMGVGKGAVLSLGEYAFANTHIGATWGGIGMTALSFILKGLYENMPDIQSYYASQIIGCMLYNGIRGTISGASYILLKKLLTNYVNPIIKSRIV